MNDYMISQKFKRFQEILLSDKAIHDLARVMCDCLALFTKRQKMALRPTLLPAVLFMWGSDMIKPI